MAGIKFMTTDRQWTVETAFLSCVAPASGTTHWGDPQHGDGLYLVAKGCGMVFYAGSASKDQDTHLAEAWAELANANLLSLDALEQVVTVEVPAAIEGQVKGMAHEYWKKAAA